MDFKINNFVIFLIKTYLKESFIFKINFIIKKFPIGRLIKIKFVYLKLSISIHKRHLSDGRFKQQIIA
jgi:hypothetical protein